LSSSYEELVKEINGNGGKAIGISTDVSDEASVKSAFGGIEKEFGGDVGAAVRFFHPHLHLQVNDQEVDKS